MRTRSHDEHNRNMCTKLITCTEARMFKTHKRTLRSGGGD